MPLSFVNIIVTQIWLIATIFGLLMKVEIPPLPPMDLVVAAAVAVAVAVAAAIAAIFVRVWIV